MGKDAGVFTVFLTRLDTQDYKFLPQFQGLEAICTALF